MSAGEVARGTVCSSSVSPVAAELLIIDDVWDMAFSIVSWAFKEDNKWRLPDGSSTFGATISDAEFLHAVNNALVFFSKGDSLVCRVRVRQWQTSNGTRTEYEVVKVARHLRAARQISLPWDFLGSCSKTWRDRPGHSLDDVPWPRYGHEARSLS
jgi:hypothetical protein